MVEELPAYLLNLDRPHTMARRSPDRRRAGGGGSGGARGGGERPAANSEDVRVVVLMDFDAFFAQVLANCRHSIPQLTTT